MVSAGKFLHYALNLSRDLSFYVSMPRDALHYGNNAKDATVYLSGDETWYDLRTGTAYKGGKSQKVDASGAIPLFQRSGTIIPRKDRFRRSTVQMENDPYTLVISLDNSGEAEGELYIDDGKSYEFKNGGAYIQMIGVYNFCRAF
ncbi:hypothetical protein L1887_02522 [Cichorium endivia]|nr:hypothetical protein L1887_02522 [Cichorium endivia]